MAQHESFLKDEHSELLAGILEVSSTQDETGKRFLELLKIFSGHLDREEETVLPLIAYLYDSVEKQPEVNGNLLKACKDFKTEYSTMVNEHEAMENIMKTIESKKASGKVMDLIGDIRHHVMLEGELIYPAAMMVANAIISNYEGKNSAAQN